MRGGTDVTQEAWIYYFGKKYANAHVDPDMAAEIEVLHIEDSNLTGGIMRAIHPNGTRTRWGHKSKGPDLMAGSLVLKDALAGDFDAQ